MNNHKTPKTAQKQCFWKETKGKVRCFGPHLTLHNKQKQTKTNNNKNNTKNIHKYIYMYEEIKKEGLAEMGPSRPNIALNLLNPKTSPNQKQKKGLGTQTFPKTNAKPTRRNKNKTATQQKLEKLKINRSN